MQAARKKLESRRLAYDASVTKMQKAKRDDFRIEEEMRVCKTKFDDSSEDVMRRMQDIQDSEGDSISSMSGFLEAQLNYHERAAEELRRVQQTWAEAGVSSSPAQEELRVPRARSDTTRSWDNGRSTAELRSNSPPAPRLPIRRLASAQGTAPPPPLPAPSQQPRQSLARATTYAGRDASSINNARVPSLARTTTDTANYGYAANDVFRDDESTGSTEGSVGWGARSASSATSYDSLSRINSLQETPLKKAPPPVNRAKKPPPPPVPARRANLGY